MSGEASHAETGPTLPSARWSSSGRLPTPRRRQGLPPGALRRLGVPTRLLVPLLCLGCASAAGSDAATERPVVGTSPAAAPAPEAPEAPAEAPASAAASPAARYLADPEAVALGRRYFQGVCTGYCHSTQAGVVKEAPDLFDCAWDHGGSDEDIFRVIAEGVPDTQMQGFGGKLPDEILWKVVAFVRGRSRCE